jgi:hypothetical protein
VAAAHLAGHLDKEHEEKDLKDILSAPVSALQGVSDRQADLLKEAFNIKTVKDLGTNKFFRMAAAMVSLSETGGKA